MRIDPPDQLVLLQFPLRYKPRIIIILDLLRFSNFVWPAHVTNQKEILQKAETFLEMRRLKPLAGV